MAKAYLFGEIEVTDPAGYEQYREAVPATIAAYDGRYVVQGGNAEQIEGEPTGRRTVILEFPSRERLMEWYNSPEYAGPKAIRFRSAKTRVWIMTGVDD